MKYTTRRYRYEDTTPLSLKKAVFLNVKTIKNNFYMSVTQ